MVFRGPENDLNVWQRDALAILEQEKGRAVPQSELAKKLNIQLESLHLAVIWLRDAGKVAFSGNMGDVRLGPDPLNEQRNKQFAEHGFRYGRPA